MDKSKIKKEQWHKKFKETLIDRGIDKKFAEEVLQAGMDDYDYDDDPVDYAVMEMSYWGD